MQNDPFPPFSLKTKYIFLRIVEGFLSFLAILAVLFLLVDIGSKIHQDDWEKLTPPVPTDSVHLLCQAFGIEATEDICKSAAPVERNLFISVVEKYYADDKNPSADRISYTEVENTLKSYREFCYRYDKDLFYCTYEINDDSIYGFSITFRYPDYMMTDLSFNFSNFQD